MVSDGAQSSKCDSEASYSSRTALTEIQPLVHPEQDLALETAQAGRKWILGRVIAVCLPILLIVGIGLAAILSNPSSTWITVAGSEGFINLQAARTLDGGLFYPPICDPQLVARVCKVLNAETEEYYDNKLDADSSIVHALELQEVFMIDRMSIVAALKNAGVTDLKDANQSEYPMKCQDLCSKMVASYPPKQVPSMSNIACVFKEKWFWKEAVCETDVSPGTLRNITFPDLFGGTDNQGGMEPDFVVPKNDTTYEGINWLVKREVLAEKSGKTMPEKLHAAQAALNYREAPFELVRHAIVNLFHIFPPTPARASIKGSSGRRLSSSGRRLKAWDETQTLQLAQKATAYASEALERMSSRSIGDKVILWYGQNDETTRAEVKRILNGVTSMLSYIDYRYPGSYCQPNYYAYVFPSEAWQNGQRLDRNSDGMPIFWLCDVYFQADDAGKIETLLHEGAHHYAMALDDSQYMGSTMYGKSACKQAASDCGGGNLGACSAALRNADTFCYFANDAHSNSPVPTPAPVAINMGSLR